MSHAAINEVVAPKSRCPVTARDDVRFIEDEVGAPAELISTGPRREETIVCRGGLLEDLLADRFSTVREAAGLSRRRAAPPEARSASRRSPWAACTSSHGGGGGCALSQIWRSSHLREEAAKARRAVTGLRPDFSPPPTAESSAESSV